jgi:hypothetical protein
MPELFILIPWSKRKAIFVRDGPELLLRVLYPLSIEICGQNQKWSGFFSHAKEMIGWSACIWKGGLTGLEVSQTSTPWPSSLLPPCMAHMGAFLPSLRAWRVSPSLTRSLEYNGSPAHHWWTIYFVLLSQNSLLLNITWENSQDWLAEATFIAVSSSLQHNHKVFLLELSWTPFQDQGTSLGMSSLCLSYQTWNSGTSQETAHGISWTKLTFFLITLPGLKSFTIKFSQCS